MPNQPRPRYEAVTLYCTQGGSDKQYTIWLERVSDGIGADWNVMFEFGPRGGWLQGGSKTQRAPIRHEDAFALLRRIVAEKRAKGYVPGADAPAFTRTQDDVVRAPAESNGLRPMLLTPDEVDSIQRYVEDDAWAAQEKMNGKRVIIDARGEAPVGYNRRGIECPIPVAVAKALKNAKVALDGELIGDVFHPFDIMFSKDADLRGNGMETRVAQLTAALRAAKVNSPHIQVVPTVFGTGGKLAFAAEMRERRREGVVFKKVLGRYEAGRHTGLRDAVAVKVKFWAEVAATVLSWNGERQSIEVGLATDGGVVCVGNVTVPAKYTGQIVVGKPVRVRYLYATKRKQLYQPCLDPDAGGQVMADHRGPDQLSALKFEGKEEE
jgi:hypothetical protein